MGLIGYLVLLGVWLLFVPPAWLATGSARRWCFAASGLGALAALYEAWMTFVWAPGVVAPIRLDIPWIGLVLTPLYLLAAVRLLGTGWSWTPLAAGLLAAAGGGAMLVAWSQAREESARLTALFGEGNQLLFEAKFRNREAYADYFGMTDTDSQAPVGHWVVEEAGIVSRLIVNPAGKVFLFHGCGDTECQYGPGATLERVDDDTASEWSAELVWRGVGTRSLRLADPEGDVLEAQVDGRRVRFRRAPPPLRGRHDVERLRALGAYSSLRPVGEHVQIVQLWLWQEENDLWAVGLFEILPPGRAEFALPQAMGRAETVGEAWRFHWRARGQSWEARLRLSAAGVEVALPGREDRWPTRTLSPGAVFRDEVMELAPRTGAAAWRHWFDTLLVGHFSAAEIPDLRAPGPRSGDPRPG